ncbi:hypothetical protein ALMP_41970 [Streptomyces sp. A012304]|nr:hypothetical protein ALMP_41970 [Streptomyces sp. A012304]
MSRLTATPRRQAGLLAALTGACLVAFFLAPNELARGSVSTANVGEAFREGFTAYWASGGRDFPAQLDTTVAFWFRFHLVKAGVSALLLAVAAAFAVVLWRHSRQRAADGRAARLSQTLAGALVGTVGLFALVALMANLQGAAAPFASLLPLLTTGQDGELTAAVTEIRQQLAASPDGRRSPALTAMIDDFAVYHAVLAALAAVVAFALAGASVMAWKRFRASADARSRRSARTAGLASALLAAVALVIAVANTMSAADSAQALSGFFAGGW